MLLIGYGSHGKNERIQDMYCQACQRKVTCRRDTVLYRIKSKTEKVALALSLLAEGSNVSSLERILGVSELTLRMWLTRAGLHGQWLHHHFFHHLRSEHIQLDELYLHLRNGGGAQWAWLALDVVGRHFDP
jgi:hypothetical protein